MLSEPALLLECHVNALAREAIGWVLIEPLPEADPYTNYLLLLYELCVTVYEEKLWIVQNIAARELPGLHCIYWPNTLASSLFPKLNQKSWF